MRTSLRKLRKKRKKILQRMNFKDLETLQETEREVRITLGIILSYWIVFLVRYYSLLNWLNLFYVAYILFNFLIFLIDF